MVIIKLSCYPLLPRHAEEESGPLDKALPNRSAFLKAERGRQRAGNAASFIMLAVASGRQVPSSCSLGAVLDHHERSEFGRMQASRRPNQR